VTSRHISNYLSTWWPLVRSSKAVNVYIPMGPTVQTAVNAVIIAIAIPFVLGAFGFLGSISW